MTIKNAADAGKAADVLDAARRMTDAAQLATKEAAGQKLTVECLKGLGPACPGRPVVLAENTGFGADVIHKSCTKCAHSVLAPKPIN